MYWLYEMGHAALDPARAMADATKLLFKNPANPLAHTTYGKSMAAAAELFERTTRRYGRPEWMIDATTVGGERVAVHINTVWERPFCRLLHFERAFTHVPRRPQPKAADRRADVGPLRHAAARHRRSLSAQSRCLHHRLAQRPLGAGGGRPLRSRRLYRLRHLHPAYARRRHACHRGVPALGAGACRRRADGSRQGSLTCRIPWC